MSHITTKASPPSGLFEYMSIQCRRKESSRSVIMDDKQMISFEYLRHTYLFGDSLGLEANSDLLVLFSTEDDERASKSLRGLGDNSLGLLELGNREADSRPMEFC